MKESFQKRLIEALESDQYKQTRGVLRDENGYCCLGVGCDLINPDGWGAPEFVRFRDKLTDDFAMSKAAQGWTNHSWVTDPTSVAYLDDFFGLSRSEIFMLADANDHGKTFKEIADMIRQIKPDNHGAP